MREALLSDGLFVDVALAALIVELAILVILARRGRTKLHPLDMVGQLLAGGLLLVALQVALAGGDPLWVAALMTASLPAHLFDVARRVDAARASAAAISERR